MTSGTELILIGRKIVPNEEHVQCTTVLPHNLLQTNPCIRHNFSTQVFRKRTAQHHYVGPELRYIWRPGNVAQLRAHIVKLCRALSEDLCQKVVMNARVR